MIQLFIMIEAESPHEWMGECHVSDLPLGGDIPSSDEMQRLVNIMFGEDVPLIAPRRSIDIDLD